MRYLILPFLLCATVALSADDQPNRRGPLYDHCLANGGTTVQCDAAMRLIAAEREKIRKTNEEACLEASADRDNPFAKIMCQPPQ